jgi:hypothetical protein
MEQGDRRGKKRDQPWSLGFSLLDSFWSDHLLKKPPTFVETGLSTSLIFPR